MKSQSSLRHSLMTWTSCPSARIIPAQRSAVIRFPSVASTAAGVMMMAFTLLRLVCACPESGPDIAAIRSVKIPIGHTDQTGPRRPGAASQSFVRAEPRTRVFLIWIFGERGIGKKIASCPLPYIADHLPAPEPGFAACMARHVAHVVLGPIEIDGAVT